MTTANSRDAVVEIHELANSPSCNGANDRPPSYSSHASPFQPWYKAPKRVITCSFTSCAVVTIAVCLLAISFNMLLFAGHAIHAVRNSPQGSDVGDDPEWPKKIDRSFHVWIICMASITFVQAALTLFTTPLSATVEITGRVVFHMICYIVLHFVYYGMFHFDDVNGHNRITNPNGIPRKILVIPGWIISAGRKYPTIISWTCMKKDNQGDSSVDYDSICHTAVSTIYSILYLPFFRYGMCLGDQLTDIFLLAHCKISRNSNDRLLYSSLHYPYILSMCQNFTLAQLIP